MALSRSRPWLWDGGLLAIAIWGAVIGGLGLGGTLETGQADPVRWLPATGVAMLMTGSVAWFRRRHWPGVPVAAGTGICIAVAVLCGIASQSWPRLPHGPEKAAGLADKPPLAIATGIDLFWSSPNGKLADMRHAPALDVLGQAFRIVRLDQLRAATLARQRTLLLAQPRLLAPQELVAIDAWVRGGGKAVILADPLLLWPMPLPLGDRRRPPATSLLDPLLAHWGLVLEPVLEPVSAGRDGVERRFLSSGALLTVAAASRFTVRAGGWTGGPCRTIEDGLMALCRIGRGQVRLIADADMLDDRLWRAEAGRQSVRRGNLTSDTMALLVRWLGTPVAPEAPLPHPIPWVRSAATLIAGLRWALLFAAAWALLFAAAPAMASGYWLARNE